MNILNGQAIVSSAAQKALMIGKDHYVVLFWKLQYIASITYKEFHPLVSREMITE